MRRTTTPHPPTTIRGTRGLLAKRRGVAKATRPRVAGWSAAGLLALLLVTGCGASTSADEATTSSGTTTADAATIEVHRSAYCDCCGVYEEYLADEGFTVTTTVREDVDVLKESLGLPFELGSCHTALVGDYFVEGHVPVEAIHQLLTEQPDIDGITLPGMPSGSPGMGGEKEADWIIYAVADGAVTEFMVL